MSIPCSRASFSKGFTLIELAIVMVVIGLIVGGIMVGQSLIRASQIQSAIGQIAEYNTSVNAFLNKYDFLPGDIPAVDAAKFGFVARAGGSGDGDGNGAVSAIPCGGTDASGCLGGENVFFWNDLTRSGLISDSFTYTTDAAIELDMLSILTNMSALEPRSKLGSNTYVHVFASFGPLNPSGNFWQIIHPMAIGSGTVANSGAISPLDAQAIDTKLDDGMPTTGTVVAMSPAAGATAGVNVPATSFSIGPPASNVCLSNASTPRLYNIGINKYAVAPNCGVRIKAAF